MSQIRQRIRIAVDITEPGQLVDLIGGGAPKFVRNTDVQLEVAFFNDGVVMTDIAGWAAATVSFITNSDPATQPVIQSVLGPSTLTPEGGAAWYTGLTSAQWTSGLAAYSATGQHLTIVLTNSQTNINMDSTSDVYQVVFEASSSVSIGGGNYYTPQFQLGYGQVTFIDTGLGLMPPSTIVTPAYLTQAMGDARYAVAVNLTTIENNITALQAYQTSLGTAVVLTTLAPVQTPTFTGTVTLPTQDNLIPSVGGSFSSLWANYNSEGLAGGTYFPIGTFYWLKGAHDISIGWGYGSLVSSGWFTITNNSTAVTLYGTANASVTAAIIQPALTIPPATTLIPNPLSGTIEYDGTYLYFTNSSNARQTLLTTAVAGTTYAPLVSPTFTGTVVAADVILTGELSLGYSTTPLSGASSSSVEAASVGWVFTNYLALGGGTMTGALNLVANQATGNITSSGVSPAASQFWVSNSAVPQAVIGTVAQSTLANPTLQALNTALNNDAQFSQHVVLTAGANAMTGALRLAYSTTPLLSVNTTSIEAASVGWSLTTFFPIATGLSVTVASNVTFTGTATFTGIPTSSASYSSPSSQALITSGYASTTFVPIGSNATLYNLYNLGGSGNTQSTGSPGTGAPSGTPALYISVIINGVTGYIPVYH